MNACWFICIRICLITGISPSYPCPGMWTTSVACSLDTSRSTTNPCSFTMSSCTASPTLSLKEVTNKHFQMRPYEQLNAHDFVLNPPFFSKVVDLFLKSTRQCSLSTHLASSKSNTYTVHSNAFTRFLR